MSDSVDPDVLALSQSLRALEVGTVPACLKFAKDLCDQGILTMELIMSFSGAFEEDTHL